MIKMVKAYDLEPYINRVSSEKQTSYDMPDGELDKLAPWSESAKSICTDVGSKVE